MRRFFTQKDPVMPVHLPHVLVQTAVQLGADEAELLAAIGVDARALEMPETRLTFSQFADLERAALRATGNSALGLYAGRNTRVSTLGMLGMAATNSATGRKALELSMRYAVWLAPGWDFSVKFDGPRGTFTVRESIPRGDLRVVATEWLAVAFYQAAAAVLEQPPVSVIRMSFPEPRHSALYAEFFPGVAVEFSHDVVEAELDMNLLQRPIRGADPATAVLAERYLITEASRAPTEGLVERIRQILMAHEGEWPDLDAMARKLQTSGRSLRRELREVRTSYQQLVDEVRLERAEGLLKHTDITVEQISRSLGFRDPRSFRRAFKRWTGRTAAEIRREARDLR